MAKKIEQNATFFKDDNIYFLKPMGFVIMLNNKPTLFVFYLIVER